MAYQVGDVVNGHRLGDDNEWHPVEVSGQPGGSAATSGQTTEPAFSQSPQSAAPIAPEAADEKPWYLRWWVIALAVLMLVLVIVGIRGLASTTTTGLSIDQPSADASVAPSVEPTPSTAPPSTAPVATVPAAPPPAVPAPSRRATTAPQPAAPATRAPAAPPAAPPAPAAGVAGLNAAVGDGDFEFTVTDVTCGRSQVGSEYLNKAAQGQFCLVSMTVANRGDDPQVFDGSYQKAVDQQGRTLPADPEAAWYIEDSQAFLEPISPGNRAQGTIVFDIPQTSTIAALELHDSAASRGAKVRVS